jgi:hypothetical protein
MPAAGRSAALPDLPAERRLMADQRPDDHDNSDQGCRNNRMTLAEQIAHLRQLAAADPNTTLLQLVIINVLGELAEAVQELRGDDPPQGCGSV